MAIEINKSSGNGNYTDEFKGSNIPATQGNVVETLDSYNDQVKLHYYDKTEARADENALQTSIMNLVKQLVINTSFTDKTVAADETSDNVTHLASVSNFSEDVNGKTQFDLSGLIQKVNIIANLLSGTTNKYGHKWTSEMTGNNVGGLSEVTKNGEEEKSARQNQLNEYVPVIGMTRADGDGYTARIEYEDGKQVLKIEGLTSVDFEVDSSGGKETKHQSIADRVVLSEEQVANMIKQSVISVLGGYDNQLGAMLGYLMFTQDEIPEAFGYVLTHTKQGDIADAPLYVKEYNDKKYYIRDLNGLSNFNGQETKDYKFNGSPITKENWKIEVKADDYKNFAVYYKDTKVYEIPIPQKSISVDFGKASDGLQILNSATLFENTKVTVAETKYKPDGTGNVEVPLGAMVSVNVPNGVNLVHHLGWSNPINNITSMESIYFKGLQENVKLYCKYVTVTLDTDDGNGVRECSGYEDSTIIINDVKNKTGYTCKKTILGKDVTDESITYKNVTDSIEDKLIWEPVDYQITYLKNDKINKLGDSISVKYGDTYKVSMEPESKKGYNFLGWKVKSTSEDVEASN